MPAASSTTPQASFHRLFHPESGLYVRFNCVRAPRDKSPRIVARLTTRERSSRFVSWDAAAQSFARFIGPAPLEIVRSDA